MATAKKTTVTKKSAAKKTVAKKPIAKTTTNATTAKKSSSPAVVSRKKSAAKKQPKMRSFRLAREEQSFTEFRITRQTVYWVILVAFIIFVQLWILKLQIEVVTLLDAQQHSSQF